MEARLAGSTPDPFFPFVSRTRSSQLRVETSTKMVLQYWDSIEVGLSLLQLVSALLDDKDTIERYLMGVPLSMQF